MLNVLNARTVPTALKKLLVTAAPITISLLLTGGGAQAGQITLQQSWAWQSSTEGPATAGLALDGNTDGNYYDGSVSDTQQEVDPYWIVDMHGLFNLNQVTIWNRTDLNAQPRLSNYLVQLFAADGTTQVWSSGVIGPYPDPSAVLAVTGQTAGGEFLKISLPGLSAPGQELQLAEVQVFGAADTAVPEPGSVILLLGGAAIGLTTLKRRAS
jgi:hypothetical protein